MCRLFFDQGHHLHACTSCMHAPPAGAPPAGAPPACMHHLHACTTCRGTTCMHASPACMHHLHACTTCRGTTCMHAPPACMHHLQGHHLHACTTCRGTTCMHEYGLICARMLNAHGNRYYLGWYGMMAGSPCFHLGRWTGSPYPKKAVPPIFYVCIKERSRRTEHGNRWILLVGLEIHTGL